MRNRSKLTLIGLAAALALGALVSAASARRLALSSQQFRATWNELRFAGGVVSVGCHVTIEGSFHSRTLSKVAEALIGYVSRVTVDSSHCTNGSARILPEKLPWHIRYDSFTGTLPAITSIKLRLVGAAFLVQVGSTACLFTSSTASPMKGVVNRNTATGAATSLTPETAEIPLTSGTRGVFACPESGRLEHTTTSLTPITVTLVA